MRVGVAFFLAALLIASALPVNANPFGTEARCVTLGSDGNEYPGSGPLRDPVGDDWITYDNGEAAGLIAGGGAYWSKVTFTPVSTFQLQAIHVLPLNQGPNTDDPMQVRVYSENQNNHGLVDMLYEFVIEQVNPWAQNCEHVIELEEDDYIRFEANESFTIMYDSPGGDYTPGEEGTGWWNLYDGANNGRRSFYTVINAFGGEPPAAHNVWNGVNDLILRANGTYLDAFIDLELTELYNADDNWLLLPGSEQTFTTDILNNGDDVEFSVVTFQVMNLDGDIVWDNQVVVDEIAEGDEVSISSDVAWEVPDVVGSYHVWCFIEVEDDANDENNQAGLDQVIINPDTDPDQWISFVDGTVENSTAWNEDSGWAVAFHHPGEGYRPMQLNAFRVQIQVAANAEVELEFAIHILDLEARQVIPIWQGTATTTGQGEAMFGGFVEWVEVVPEWDDPEIAYECTPGKAIMVTYFYDAETRFPQDTDPPFAGTNTVMPWANMSTQDDGGGYNFSNSGDYPIEAQLGWFDGPIRGKHLAISPDELDFGFNLELNTDYVIQAEFTSTGTDTLTVSRVRVSPTLQAYVTVDPAGQFEIASGEMAVVTVTFNAAEDVTAATQLLISSDSEDNANIVWPFRASTAPEPGGHLETAEMSLDLGYNLAMNEDHVIVGTLNATGDEAIHINAIVVPEEIAGYLTVDPAGDFDIEAGASAEVTFTFNTAEEIDVTAFIGVDNTSLDEGIGWTFHAATVPMPPMIMVDPENLMFGFELEPNTDYTIDAMIYSEGEEDLMIQGFTVPEEFGDFITLTYEGDLPITLAADASLAVAVTFNGADIANLDGDIVIVNNSANHPNFEWHLRASLFPEAVNEAPIYPAFYGLSQNYPNPFNPVTTVEFSIGLTGNVELGIFDLSGRRVLDVLNAYMPAGSHSVEINASELPAGSYLYRLHSGDFTSTRKMVLMK